MCIVYALWNTAVVFHPFDLSSRENGGRKIINVWILTSEVEVTSM